MENPCPLTPDDICQAFRWILDRDIDPASLATLEKSGHSPTEFRKQLLHSPEFLETVGRLQLLADHVELNRFAEDSLPRDHGRTVVFDIPLSGSNRIRRLIKEGLPGARLCPESANLLPLRNALDLASYDLFIGNFDHLSIRCIPGRIETIVIMLADPRQRIIALHRHLRSYDEKVARESGWDLALLAKQHSLEEFLSAALSVNAGAIDNCYARSLGGELSHAPWESRAVPSIDAPLSSDQESRYLNRALQLLDQSIVGLGEEPEKSRAIIAGRLGINPVPDMQRERLDAVVYRGQYSWVPPEDITPSAEAILEDLTRLDRVIYEKAQKIFSAALSIA